MANSVMKTRHLSASPMIVLVRCSCTRIHDVSILEQRIRGILNAIVVAVETDSPNEVSHRSPSERLRHSPWRGVERLRLTGTRLPRAPRKLDLVAGCRSIMPATYGSRD